MSKPAKPKSEILDEAIVPDLKVKKDSSAQKEADLFAVLSERMDHMATQSWVWYRLFGVATTVIFLILGILAAIGTWVRGLLSWLVDLK